MTCQWARQAEVPKMIAILVTNAMITSHLCSTMPFVSKLAHVSVVAARRINTKTQITAMILWRKTGVPHAVRRWAGTVMLPGATPTARRSVMAAGKRLATGTGGTILTLAPLGRRRRVGGELLAVFDSAAAVTPGLVDKPK